MILTDYHIGTIGAIKANADYNHVEISTDDENNIVVFYTERGKDMAAIILNEQQITKTMPRELYDNPPEIESAPILEVEEPSDENNESA